ncbi:hypothetical protein D3C87_1222180 [compost metagenome]
MIRPPSGLPPAPAAPPAVPFRLFSSTPAAATVLPVSVTTPPSGETIGLSALLSMLPPVATVLPSLVSRLSTGTPRPLAPPTVCVVSVSLVVSGTMALLALPVSCATGPVDRLSPSLPPTCMTVPPTVCTTPPTGCVTGASGESCAVPSDWTRSPALTTVLPACVTTLPVLPTVTPSGLSTLPILPSPSRTPTPSVATVSPAFITTSPVAFCAASGTTGRFASLTCCPISLTALPVATTVLPAPSVTLAVGVVSTEAAGVGVAGGGVTLLLPFGEAPLP